VAAHEDFSIVLVQGTLIVTNSRHVLDDNTVIWVLPLLVENVIGSNHVVDNVGFGNLLGAELPLGAQIHSIIVSEMVVACNRGKLDTSVDHEINESRFHLGLARLEVITTNKGTVLLCKFNGTRDESVLWRSIDEWSTFENASHCKDGGWGDFLVASLDGLDQVLGSVIDALDNICIAFRVGGPLNDDLVETISRFEFPIRGQY
jgi:hypothetical protein